MKNSISKVIKQKSRESKKKNFILLPRPSFTKFIFLVNTLFSLIHDLSWVKFHSLYSKFNLSLLLLLLVIYLKESHGSNSLYETENCIFISILKQFKHAPLILVTVCFLMDKNGLIDY